MSFDAGKIIAYLELNTTQFDATIQEKVGEVGGMNGATATVNIDADASQFDRTAAAVIAEKLALETPVDVPIKADAAAFDAKTVLKDLQGALTDAGALDENVGLRLAPGAVSALEKGIQSSLGSGSGIRMPGLTGSENLAYALVGQGLTEAEVKQALGQTFGYKPAEIKQIMASALASMGTADAAAEAIAVGILPTTAALDAAIAKGHYSFVGKGTQGAIDAAVLKEYQFVNRAVQHAIEGEGQAALTSGSGGGALEKIITSVFTGGASDAGGGKSTGGIDRSKILDPEIRAAWAAANKDALGMAKGGTGGPFGSGGGFLSSVPGVSGSIMGGGSGALGTAGLPGILGLLPTAGAVGTAAGGIGAGTTIGSLGTLMALIPGLLDLKAGATAYSDSKSGTADPGATASDKTLGNALGGLVGSGSSGLGQAETTVMPQVIAFIKALTGAMPEIEKFGNTAVKAMGGFFSSVDKGLGSGGFKTFMSSMTHLVGPIMTQFGHTISNFAGGLGHLLILFGEIAKSAIGPWFERVSGDFDTWSGKLNNASGMTKGMVGVFNELGKILDPVIKLLAALFKAFEPIGQVVLKVAGWLAQNLLPGLTKIIDSKFGHWLAIIAVAFVALTAPISATTLLIVGIVAAIGYVSTHWTAIWGDIKKVAEDAWKYLDNFFHSDLGQALLWIVSPILQIGLHWDAVWGGIKSTADTVWHFLDNNIFHPLGSFFTTVLTRAIDGLKTEWDIIWNGIQTTVQTIWNILKPIFDAISGAIKTITDGIGGVLGAAKGIGGAIGSVGHFLGLATGGTVQAGQTYLVGENGPEIFTSATPGTILPNSSLTGGHSVTIYVDARGATNPSAVQSSAKTGVTSAMPMLTAALARGATP